MARPKRITLVDETVDYMTMLAGFLKQADYDVTIVPYSQGMFDEVRASTADVIICDVGFENIDPGWALVDMLFLSPETRSIPVVLCIVFTDAIREIVPSLSGKGIVVLEKPVALETVITTLAHIDDNPEAKLRQFTGTSRH